MTNRTFKEMEKCPLSQRGQVDAWLRKLGEVFKVDVPPVPELPLHFTPSVVAGAIFHATYYECISLQKIGRIVRRAPLSVHDMRIRLYPEIRDLSYRSRSSKNEKKGIVNVRIEMRKKFDETIMKIIYEIYNEEEPLILNDIIKKYNEEGNEPRNRHVFRRSCERLENKGMIEGFTGIIKSKMTDVAMYSVRPKK